MILFISGFIGVFSIIALVILVLLIPLVALVDILSSHYEGNDKLIWVLVVLFFPFLGALIYFIIGRQRKIL